jgi:hypothetical protein
MSPLCSLISCDSICGDRIVTVEYRRLASSAAVPLLEDKQQPLAHRKRKTAVALLCAIAGLVSLMLLLIRICTIETPSLSALLKVENIVRHLSSFDHIALENGGNRAAGYVKDGVD